MIKQTAGRDQLGKLAPNFAHYNDDILFGEDWNDTSIDLKTRCIITVVSLMSMGITDNSLMYHLENAKKNAVNILKNEKKSKKDGINNPKNGNVIDKQILKLFNNSYGNDFSEEDYKDIKEEGIRRKDNCIPPGYAGKDKNKEENGDYYIFYSMIQESKATKKDVIFITDDVKEDWFNYCDGETDASRSKRTLGRRTEFDIRTVDGLYGTGTGKKE